MLVVGLTGGIGSGKSTVADLFAQYKITIIDTDQISRKITSPDTPGLARITQHFGKTILKPDNTLDRTALRKKIFAHPEERIWLEQLLHPMIWQVVREQVIASTSPYCIVVVPLLTEFSVNSLIQRILVVDATPEQQIHRTVKRDQAHPDDVSAIVSIQSSREKRLEMADDVILNDGSPEDLAVAVEKLHQTYLKLAMELKS